MGVIFRTFRSVALGIVLSGTVAAATLSAETPPPLAASTDAQPLPAVDGTNIKASGFGGAADGRAFLGGEGSITVPLGHQFGFQMDGLLAGIDTRPQGDVTVAAIAGHLFWRDPAVGLLGAYGHHVHADAFSGVNLFAGAAEGALYLGRFTLEGVAGIEGGEVDFGALGSRSFETRFFDVAQLGWYPIDNLKLSVGHSYVVGTHAAQFGAEWGFSVGDRTMSSLYASGRVNEDGDASVLGGLRLYFGQRDKTLIRRHREDDPPSIINTTQWTPIMCEPGVTGPACPFH